MTTVAGTIAPGNSVGQLTVNGNLTLALGSVLEFELGQANTVGGSRNDLIKVTNNLALQGAQLRVVESAGGSFGIGWYRIIDYDGTLTTSGSGLTIDGALPNSLTGSIDTSTLGQVNLVVLAGGPPVVPVGGTFQYWDGANTAPGAISRVDGGTGTWTATQTNWTTATGDTNGAWTPELAIFQGTAGTVNLAYRPTFQGLVFNVGDYLLQASTGAAGEGLRTAASGAFVSVTGAFDATIAAPIDGTGSLDKQGAGRLILTGANSYTGGTTITAGTLAVGHNSALGTAGVTLRNGTTLQAFGGDRALANAVTLAGTTGTLDTQDFRLTLTGPLSVQDTLRKLGNGTLALTLADPAAPVPVVSFRQLDLTAGTLENHRSLNLSGGVEMGSGTTLDNRLGASITAGSAGITGGNGAQTVINAGTITAPVSLGAGNDRYELQNFAVQTGRVDGGAGTDTAAFRVDAGNTRTIVGNQFFNFELLEKSGDGTLRLIPGTDSLATATVRILGGQVINETTVRVSNRVDLDNSGITWTNTAGGSVTATAQVAIQATRNQVTVANSGAVTGEVRFTSDRNTYILSTTGTQAGQVNAGNASTTNRAQIDAPTTGGGRTISQASFVNFGQIDLNQAANAAGRIVLAAAPAGQMTLDTGAMAGSRTTLHRGELVLPDQGSSVRAATVELERDTVVRGNGTISTRPDGGGSLGTITARGMVAPGNSIGTLNFVGNYVQTGPYAVEYRPPPIGTARGRNTAEGSTLADQDADLISVTGTATLTGGTIVPVRLGTAASMNAALSAQGPGGTLRWLVLRAQGGLGGTRYVALSNVAEVRVEYPANGTDVELVLASPVTDDDGKPPPVMLPSGPPPALPARDGTLRQWGLSQNGVLFDLAADCDRPIGLSAAARDENWCSFGQGRLLTASGEGSDGMSVYGGAWSQSGLGQSRLRVADAATGVMRRVGDEAWLGMAVGYGLGWFDFGGAGGEAYKTSFNALQLAGLGRWAYGPLELRGMLGYGWSEVESRRPSGLRGGDQRLVADYDLQQATAAAEARWWFGTRGDWALAPTLRLTGARQWRGGYSEEGTSADRFTAQQATWDSLRMALGVTGEIGTSLYGKPLVVEPRLGWVRELGDRSVTVSGTYAGAPGQVMTGRGGPAPRDSAVTGLAGIVQLTDSTRLRLGYDGSWYDGGSSHSVTMRLSYAW
jgi:autotransporter-associated beta strand protein